MLEKTCCTDRDLVLYQNIIGYGALLVHNYYKIDC